MKTYAILTFLAAGAAVAAGTDAPTIETLELSSKTFGNKRSIRVLLPPGYHDARNAHASYPVLYLNDGVSVFKPSAVDIATVAGDLFRRRLIPPIIVVGIDNGGSTDKTTNPGIDRAMEYLPFPDAGFEPGHSYPPDPAQPRGRLYPQFLIGEVIPLVRRHYRVSVRPGDVAVGGSSYGGDAALFAVMTHPGMFGGLLLESTPLWVGGGQLLRQAKDVRTWPRRVYLGLGTKESDDEAINAQGRAELNALRKLIERGSPAAAVHVEITEGATHGPPAWRERLPVALQFLFGSRLHVQKHVDPGDAEQDVRAPRR